MTAGLHGQECANGHASAGHQSVDLPPMRLGAFTERHAVRGSGEETTSRGNIDMATKKTSEVSEEDELAQQLAWVNLVVAADLLRPNESPEDALRLHQAGVDRFKAHRLFVAGCSLDDALHLLSAGAYLSGAVSFLAAGGTMDGALRPNSSHSASRQALRSRRHQSPPAFHSQAIRSSSQVLFRG